MSGRHIIIGDIHGCVEEFDALIDSLSLTTEDTVILAGDLVDKGPHSASVVGRARALREGGFNVVLVMGNHEEKHSRFRTRLAAGADTTVLKGHEEMDEITRGMCSEDVWFLNSAVLFHRIEEFNSIVVHAGIPMSLQQLPPSPGDVEGLSRKERDRLNLMMRVRYVRPSTGSMVPLGEEQEGDVYWAESYDGRFGHVYFGHEPFMDGREFNFPNATGLDHGCVFGGRLSAMVLTPGSREIVSVPARTRYSVPHLQDV